MDKKNRVPIVLTWLCQRFKASLLKAVNASASKKRLRATSNVVAIISYLLHKYNDLKQRRDHPEEITGKEHPKKITIEQGLVRALVQGSRRTLYKVMVAIDPLLFFTLRSINMQVFLQKTMDERLESMLERAAKPVKRVLKPKEVKELFNI